MAALAGPQQWAEAMLREVEVPGLEESSEGAKLLLGEDIVECLHWRRGALSFMRSSQLHDAGRGGEVSDGEMAASTAELKAMLCVKPRFDVAEVEIEGSNDQVGLLLAEGCYSTNHALAMVYIGELGFLRLTNDTAPAEQREAIRSEAEEWLTRYIKCCEICLNQQGWSDAKAKQMLAALPGAHETGIPS